jgi:hypothetical protein
MQEQQITNSNVSLSLSEYNQMVKDQALLEMAMDRIIQLKKDLSFMETTVYNKTTQLYILNGHLGKMLDEREAEFSNRGHFESYEHANDYVEAAKAAEVLGRKTNRIKEVTEWLNSEDSLPFK